MEQLFEWSSEGGDIGRFMIPYGVDVDENVFMKMFELLIEVHKIDSEGTFLMKIGSERNKDQESFDR